MRTSCLALGILTLAFGLATPALAQGGPPAHAGQAGPPDHAPAEAEPDPAPPDHASGGPDPSDEAADTDEPEAEAGSSTASSPEDEGDVEVAAPTDEGTDERASDEEGTSRVESEATDGETGTSTPRSSTRAPIPSPEPVEETNADDAAPLALEGVRSAGTETETTTPNAGSGSPGVIAGMVPGLLLGAVGVLALAIHVGPARPERGRPVGRQHTPATEAAGEPAEPEPSEDEGPTRPSRPGGVAGLVTLGQEALAEGDIEAAANWFETATELAPGLQVARFCLGLCLDEQGRLREAEEQLREARALEDDAMARYAHASVLARLGRTREAVEIFERLASLRPELRERMREDEDLANLRDHPRFLALLGELRGG